MIVVMSLWRNDASRRIESRVRHLMAKRARGHMVRWLWAVGDSTDDTEQQLRDVAASVLAESYEPLIVDVIRCDTGIVGDDTQTLRKRLATTANLMFAHVLRGDEFACLHESDLITPPDILDRFLGSGHMPVAGWPVIKLNGRSQFYDIWAYRDMKGVPFSPNATANKPVQVSSFGSCWMAPASLVRDRIINTDCIVDLCRQWTREGVKLWADPSIRIEQPVQLWVSR